MRPLLLALLLVGAAFSALCGRSLPLTLKEVNLMLRSGYSSEAVQRELSLRRLAESCDDAAEKSLADAGATQALISAIKNGSYESSPADAQVARDQLAAQAQKRAIEAERLRKMDSLYQSQRARERVGPLPLAAGSVVADLVKGDLVHWNNGSLARFGDETLANKKIFALYFSASWCGPCRKFTPLLVEYYNGVKAQHPEFELIFVSKDRSAFGMEAYMRDTKMPWPAIDFGKLASKAAIQKYAGAGIPCLVLLDASGRVLSDTYAGGTRVGPEKVLTDLAAFLGKTSAGGIAGTR